MQNDAPTASRAGGPAVRGTAPARLPLVVYVLAPGTFLMLTTEFVVAGILPEIAGDLDITLAQAGSLITVFAIGMAVGAPSLALLTLRLSKKLTLLMALAVFGVGHVVVALSADLTMLMVARFVTALATGAFWAVAAVVASSLVDSTLKSSAVGVVAAGGSLATVLGVPVGAFVAQHLGWRGTFWALAFAAVVAVVFIVRLVPADAPRAPESRESSLFADLADLRSPRLWLVLAACLTTTGGVLSAYSFIAPVLTDQSGLSAALVPAVLAGFGIFSFVGTLVGGRLGDRHAHAVVIATPAATTLVLLAMALWTGSTWWTVVLVLLLGAFGLSANGVLIHLAVRHAGRAETLGSGLAVAAFNAGTAIGTTIAGASLTSSLGLSGPAAVGTVIVALTLVPTTVLAVASRRRAAAPSPSPLPTPH